MTIVTTNSAIAFAPQVGTTPGDDSASKLVDITTAPYRWLPTTRLSFGTVQNQSPLPQELSGTLLPRGAYKGGSYVGGTFDFIPRVGGSHLHWFLYSFGSSWEVDEETTDVKFGHYYGTGDNAIAAWDPTSEASKATSGGGANDTDRYLSFKRLLPPANADDTLTTTPGETFEDCRIGQLQFNFAPGTPVGCTAAIVGRKGAFVEDTSAGVSTYWNPAYEATASNFPGLQASDEVLLGCKGSFELPTPGNTLDLSVLSTTLKKNMYDINQQVVYNGGAAWSPIVWRSGEPLKLISETASDTLFGGGTFAGALEFWAQDIMWTITPLTYSAGEILTANLTGIVLEPTAGSAAWYVKILNDRDPDEDEDAAISAGFFDWPTA